MLQALHDPKQAFYDKLQAIEAQEEAAYRSKLKAASAERGGKLTQGFNKKSSLISSSNVKGEAGRVTQVQTPSTPGSSLKLKSREVGDPKL